MFSNDYSSVKNDTLVNEMMVGAERQRFNSNQLGVRNATMVNGLMAREEKQSLNNDRLGVLNATGLNKLMVGEERQRVNNDRIGGLIATWVNRLMAREKRQRLTNDRIGVQSATRVNRLMAREERQRLNNDRIGVPIATGVNRLMTGEERQRLNNDRISVPIATGINRLMAGEETQRFYSDYSSVQNDTLVNEMMVGAERQRFISNQLGVRNATRVNELMAREETQMFSNDYSSVQNDTLVNKMMVEEETQRFTSDRLGYRKATRVNESMVGEERQRINRAEPDRKEFNRRFVKYNYFTKMKFGPVYIFGITLGNTTSTAHWDVIKIRASMGLIYAKETHFICCIKYIDLSYYTSQPVTSFNMRHPRASLSAVHFTCRNPRPGVVPSGVALALNNQACGDEHVTYRRPETPKREPGVKLAISAKLAYGNRNAEMLIEFMELYKYLGVDKFVTYFLKDLNEDARKVLEYYASTGMLDLYYFEPAEEGNIKRRFNPPDDQTGSDKQVLTFDAFERMSGYTYFGIIDFDEFLIPSKDRSLKGLLADLFVENYNAAGFTFQSKHYCVNKGRQGTINDLMFGQFVTTSTKEPQYYCQKNIYKPMYMDPDHILTHVPRPANSSGHMMVKISAKEGYIRHFRHCPDNYPKHFPLKRELINDNWLAEWSRRIQLNVETVRFRVFGSSKYVTYP